MFKDAFVIMSYDHAYQVTAVTVKKFNMTGAPGGVNRQGEPVSVLPAVTVKVDWTLPSREWQHTIMSQLSEVSNVWYVNLTRENQALKELLGEVFFSKLTEQCYKTYTQMFRHLVQHLPGRPKNLTTDYCVGNIQHLYLNYKWDEEKAA